MADRGDARQDLTTQTTSHSEDEDDLEATTPPLTPLLQTPILSPIPSPTPSNASSQEPSDWDAPPLEQGLPITEQQETEMAATILTALATTVSSTPSVLNERFMRPRKRHESQAGPSNYLMDKLQAKKNIKAYEKKKGKARKTRTSTTSRATHSPTPTTTEDEAQATTTMKASWTTTHSMQDASADDIPLLKTVVTRRRVVEPDNVMVREEAVWPEDVRHVVDTSAAGNPTSDQLLVSLGHQHWPVALPQPPQTQTQEEMQYDADLINAIEETGRHYIIGAMKETISWDRPKFRSAPPSPATPPHPALYPPFSSPPPVRQPRLKWLPVPPHAAAPLPATQEVHPTDHWLQHQRQQINLQQSRENPRPQRLHPALKSWDALTPKEKRQLEANEQSVQNQVQLLQSLPRALSPRPRSPRPERYQFALPPQEDLYQQRQQWQGQQQGQQQGQRQRQQQQGQRQREASPKRPDETFQQWHQRTFSDHSDETLDQWWQRNHNQLRTTLQQPNLPYLGESLHQMSQLIQDQQVTPQGQQRQQHRQQQLQGPAQAQQQQQRQQQPPQAQQQQQQLQQQQVQRPPQAHQQVLQGQHRPVILQQRGPQQARPPPPLQQQAAFPHHSYDKFMADLKRRIAVAPISHRAEMMRSEHHLWMAELEAKRDLDAAIQRKIHMVKLKSHTPW